MGDENTVMTMGDMTINNDGKVGIGTDNPTETLQVNGNIKCDVVKTDKVKATKIKADEADIDNIESKLIQTKTILFETAVASECVKTAELKTLQMETKDAIIEHVKCHDIKADDIIAHDGKIENILTDSIKAKCIDTKHIESHKGTIEHFKAYDLEAEKVKIHDANIDHIITDSIKTKLVESKHIGTMSFETKCINAEHSEMRFNKVETIESENIKTKNIKSKLIDGKKAEVKEINTKELYAKNIQSNTVRSRKTRSRLIKSGFIKARAVQSRMNISKRIHTNRIRSNVIRAQKVKSESFEGDSIKSYKIESNSLDANYLNSKHIKADSITAQSSASRVYMRNKSACVGIEAKFGEYEYYAGSGTFVEIDHKYGYVVTAAHVLMNSDRTTKADAIWLNITNFNDTGENKFIKITEGFYVDGLADVAVIKVPGINGGQSHLSFTDYSTVANGDTVYMMGYAGGYDNASISHGLVRDKSHTTPFGETRLDNLLISAPGLDGNSGSVILDIHGKIIGITGWSYDFSETLSGGVKGDMLESIMKILVNRMENGNGSDYIEKRFLGIDWTLVTFDMLDKIELNEISSDGIVLWEDPIEASPFYEKVHKNDIIISFNIDNKEYTFGYESKRVSPHTLTHLITESKDIVVKFKDFSNNFEVKTINVTLNKDYSTQVEYDTFSEYTLSTVRDNNGNLKLKKKGYRK